MTTLKGSVLGGACLGLIALASPANAGVFSTQIDLGGAISDGELGSGDGTEAFIDVEAPEGLEIIGFTWALSFEAFDPSWGSEARIEITSPGGSVYTFSGDDAGWATDPGIFVDGGETDAFNGGPLDGVWSFRFYEDFDDGISPDGVYHNAVFLIKAIPGPGGLALLGLAGLAGRRRRR